MENSCAVSMPGGETPGAIPARYGEVCRLRKSGIFAPSDTKG